LGKSFVDEEGSSILNVKKVKNLEGSFFELAINTP
jgi:hypothetical protein